MMFMTIHTKDGESRVKFGQFFWWLFVTMALFIGWLVSQGYATLQSKDAALEIRVTRLEEAVSGWQGDTKVMLNELKHVNVKLDELQKQLTKIK